MVHGESITQEEETTLRMVNGKLNWIATQTRPDLSFDVSVFSSMLKKDKVKSFKQLNKNVKKAKREVSHIYS